jgi:hypothetical protein
MYEMMSHYAGAIGMPPVGAFCVAFTVIICWGRLVEDFGAIGGMMAAAFIIGTFWVLNHKLPGFGINPELIPHPDGGSKQFGLIYQGFRGAAPWVDMGTAIAAGMWVCGLCETARGGRLWAAAESGPRVLATVLGGAIGGAMVGLIGWTGANLFGYK